MASRAPRHQPFTRMAPRHQPPERDVPKRGHAIATGKWLYGSRWRKARAAFLAENPLCVQCHAAGRTTAATDVDHVVPHRGDEVLFWRRSNWQALCHTHHSAKTAAEDGGFGNRRSAK